MTLLTTRDIYIDFVVRNYRDRINKTLSELTIEKINGRNCDYPIRSHKKRSKLVRRIRNPRHVDKLEEFSDISYKKFRDIIKYMNTKVMDEIAEGKTFEMKNSLGNIYCKRFETLQTDVKKLRKNWNASLKLKKEIEERGETPLVHYKDENFNILGDNGGVNWFVYYTDDFIVRYKWWRYRRSNENYKNGFKYGLMKIGRYYFKPTKENKLNLSHKTKKMEHELEFEL